MISANSCVSAVDDGKCSSMVNCNSNDDHVNPHVLLFAAFCSCKINPRKIFFSIFNGSQTLILSNLILF